MKELKAKISEQLLQNASFEGWNNSSLEKSAESAGYDKKYAYIAFPNGISDATDYLAEVFDNLMLSEIKKRDLSKMKIRDKIATGVIVRLEIYNQHKEAIKKLIAYYSLPQNASRTITNISHTVSHIWYTAGDNSTDYNYYTKRFLLAGVYSSTILYWLNDNSTNFSDTKEFLYRRIENVMEIQKAKSKIQNILACNFA